MDCPICGGYKPWHRDICWGCFIRQRIEKENADATDNQA